MGLSDIGMTGAPSVVRRVTRPLGGRGVTEPSLILLHPCAVAELGLDDGGGLVEIRREGGDEFVLPARVVPSTATGEGDVRLNPLLRAAVGATLGDLVRMRPVELQPLESIRLIPAVDVSTAHHLVEHLSKELSQARAPLGVGAVLHATFAHSTGGTIYFVSAAEPAAGIVTENTSITVEMTRRGIGEAAGYPRFADIGGLTREIELLKELIQLPLHDPSVYRQLGIQAPKGILLYGPPGVGKTLVARAASNELDAQFYFVSGPELVGSHYGETEANLRSLFAEATHHIPSVILVDEVDALSPKRDRLASQADVRMVTQLLSLLDGLEKVDGLVVMGTTNRLESVDAAFRRPGRFDREVYFGPPDEAGRLAIIDIHSRDTPMSQAAEAYLPVVARVTHGFVGADLLDLVREAGLSALRRIRLSAGAGGGTRDELQVEVEDFHAAIARTRPSALRQLLVREATLMWDDIGGLEAAKQRLRTHVVQPLSDPERYRRLRIEPPRGVVIHGPAGTGKSLLAQAVAAASDANFLSVDGPELFSPWLGESEEAVRHLFRLARDLAPAIVLVEQLQAIGGRQHERSGSPAGARVLAQLIAELDGIEPLTPIVVIGVTSSLDAIEPALLRPGRLSLAIETELPDAPARQSIAALNLRGVGVSGTTEEAEAARIAALSEGLSGAHIRAAIHEARLTAAGAGRESVTSDEITEQLERAIGHDLRRR